MYVYMHVIIANEKSHEFGKNKEVSMETFGRRKRKEQMMKLCYSIRKKSKMVLSAYLLCR